MFGSTVQPFSVSKVFLTKSFVSVCDAVENELFFKLTAHPTLASQRGGGILGLK